MDTKRTFYVSSFRGDDRNDGTSAQTAFQTLEKINCQERQPGDQILLERGSVFRNEYLHIFAGGSKEAPVVVDAYGEGDLPRIEALYVYLLVSGLRSAAGRAHPCMAWICVIGSPPV